jgi:hypothetical protein
MSRESELTKDIDVTPARITQTYEGEGTTHRPVINYLDETETLKDILTSRQKSISIGEKDNGTSIHTGNPTYVFTDKRLLALMPSPEEDLKIEIPYFAIGDIEVHTGLTKHRIEVTTVAGESVHLWISNEYDGPRLGLAIDPAREEIAADVEGGFFFLSGTLRVESWTGGPADIDAEISTASRTREKSKGLHIGALSATSSNASTTTTGEVTGEISDNTYTSNIATLQIYDGSLVLNSEIKLDIELHEIDSIFLQESGFVIEVKSTTFRCMDLADTSHVSDAVEYIQQHVDAHADADTDSDDGDLSSKIRDLKQLHEEGLLSDEEFESKKQELLDEF